MEKEQLITLAKALAKALQETEEYKNLEIAKQANDNDGILQDLIGQFNLKKLTLNNSKNDDLEKLNKIQEDAKEIYEKIMSNTNMQKYSMEKEKMNSILKDIDYIINSAANGANPDEIINSQGCGGSCSSCSGCHN